MTDKIHNIEELIEAFRTKTVLWGNKNLYSKVTKLYKEEDLKEGWVRYRYHLNDQYSNAHYLDGSASFRDWELFHVIEELA